MYVQEANDRSEIAMQDREDREDMARARLEESYRQEWFDAVTTEPLDSFVVFDRRIDWEASRAIGQTYKREMTRESTVLELFSDLVMDGDFDARIAQIVIDAHRAGSVEATKLLNDMAAAYAGGKV